LSVYDKEKARLSFDRAAPRYDQSAHLQRHVAEHLIAIEAEQVRLATTILDAGCGTGQVTEAMCVRYPKSNVVALDFSRQMLVQAQKRLQAKGLDAHMVCADAEVLPFSHNTFDLITSSLMLQWSNNLTATLQGMREVLAAQGTLIFSTLVEGTLREVKQSWRAVDEAVHTSEFMSPSLLQQHVEAAGFSQVDIRYETIVMEYASAREMVMEMKQIGASNAHKDRARGLTGKQRFQAFERAFEVHRLASGQYPCTWKLAYIVCGK